MVTDVLFVQASGTHTPNLLSSAYAPGAHYLCHRCCNLRTLHMPRAFSRTMCSWRALLVPPLMKLVHFWHASSLYSTCVLLARTTCTADYAACALLVRLEPLLDACASGAHYSLVPPMMQLVQSSNASGLYSIRVPWQARTAPRCYSLCSLQRLGLLLDPGSLAGTNCPTDATACAVFERLEPLLHPGSLVGMNCPADATGCAVSERLRPLLDPGSWQARTAPPMLQLM